MDRQRIINLFAAISTITIFGFALGLMFPLLALIMEKRGIDPDVIGYNTAMQPLGIILSVFTTPILVHKFGAKRATIGAAFATGTFAGMAGASDRVAVAALIPYGKRVRANVLRLSE